MTDRRHLLRAALALAGAGLLVCAGASAPRAASTRKANPVAIPLSDTRGRTHTLSEFRSARALVVVFLGVSCPLSNTYAEPLSNLARRYAARGVRFVGINAQPSETAEQVAQHAAEYRLAFPVWKDPEQRLALALGARVTPEAFLLDGRRAIRYRGRIDDRYVTRTQRRPQVGSRDLEAALEAVLAGRPVPKRETQALGCAIPLPTGKPSVRSAEVTFHRDVAPILQRHCQECHRPGQVAPFSLLTYPEARAWAREIREFTANRQMPPWKAEPGFGDFEGVRRLSDAEIATLAKWAEAGAPEGDPRDAPPARRWPDGWMLGTPDLVLTMPEPFSVEATGDDVFRCFVLPTGLTEDRQVVAVEIQPGNPRVVHHVLNFIDVSGRARQLDARDPGPGYDSGPGGIGFFPAGGIGGWAPGNLPRFLPKGVGRRLPKGADLVMQVHYHKTGKPETDRTRVGLYFAKEPVERQLRVWPLTNLAIDIPPGARRHEVRASIRTPIDVELLTVTPHMHLLGKEMRVWATLPDGSRKELVWIREWDYRWQDTYRYREPVRLPRGTQIELVAYYDNSEANPLNPNRPPKRVRFGEQTTDEMCFAFFEFVTPQDGGGVEAARAAARRLLGGE